MRTKSFWSTIHSTDQFTILYGIKMYVHVCVDDNIRTFDELSLHEKIVLSTC